MGKGDNGLRKGGLPLPSGCPPQSRAGVMLPSSPVTAQRRPGQRRPPLASPEGFSPWGLALLHKLNPPAPGCGWRKAFWEGSAGLSLAGLRRRNKSVHVLQQPAGRIWRDLSGKRIPVHRQERSEPRAASPTVKLQGRRAQGPLCCGGSGVCGSVSDAHGVSSPQCKGGRILQHPPSTA